MPPNRTTALHHLLYLLKSIHHLHESHFYLACLSDAKAIPPRFSNLYDSSLIGLIHSVQEEYCFLSAGLAGFPQTLSDSPTTTRRLIKKVERLMAECEKQGN